MKKYLAMGLILCTFMVTYSVMGEETKTPVLTETGTPSVVSSLIVNNLDSVVKGVYSLLGLLLSWWTAHRSYKHYQNATIQEAVEALEAGVAHSEDDFVTWAKKASADGTLTKEERQEAMKIARNKAIEVAKGPALSLLKNKGPEILNAWIKKILERRKNATNPSSVAGTAV